MHDKKIKNGKDATYLNDLWVEAPQLRDAPIAGEKLPLIIFSHGYIAAAVDHYGNTRSYFDLKSSLMPWNKPLDISFIISELLKDESLAAHINPDKIGFIGHSQGANITKK